MSSNINGYQTLCEAPSFARPEMTRLRGRIVVGMIQAINDANLDPDRLYSLFLGPAIPNQPRQLLPIDPDLPPTTPGHVMFIDSDDYIPLVLGGDGWAHFATEQTKALEKFCRRYRVPAPDLYGPPPTVLFESSVTGDPATLFMIHFACESRSNTRPTTVGTGSDLTDIQCQMFGLPRVTT